MNILCAIYIILSLLVVFYLALEEVKAYFAWNSKKIMWQEIAFCIICVILSPLFLCTVICLFLYQKLSKNHIASYEYCQNKSGFHTGDRVTVNQTCESGEMGWTNEWTEEMSYRVGKQGTVEDNWGSYGLTVRMLEDGKEFNFPYFVLSKNSWPKLGGFCV